jgi:hypothetical protein
MAPRHAKVTANADRDFHAEAAKLLRELAKRRTEHRRNIASALAERKAQGKPLGRPRIVSTVEDAISASLRAGRKGIRAIVQQHGFGTGTVQRIKAEMGGNKLPRSWRQSSSATRDRKTSRLLNAVPQAEFARPQAGNAVLRGQPRLQRLRVAGSASKARPVPPSH